MLARVRTIRRDIPGHVGTHLKGILVGIFVAYRVKNCQHLNRPRLVDEKRGYRPDADGSQLDTACRLNAPRRCRGSPSFHPPQHPTAPSWWSFPSQPFHFPFHFTKLAREPRLARSSRCVSRHDATSKIVDVEKLREKRIEEILSRNNILLRFYIRVCIYIYIYTYRVYNCDYFPREYFERRAYMYTVHVYHD